MSLGADVRDRLGLLAAVREAQVQVALARLRVGRVDADLVVRHLCNAQTRLCAIEIELGSEQAHQLAPARAEPIVRRVR